MVDGVNETSAQSSIYSISLSDLGTLNLDDKTEKAIRKYFAKHDITNEDTLDLSIYDKDHSGDIDDDERKEAGLSKKVVNAFNKILQVKSKIIANKLANEQIQKYFKGDINNNGIIDKYDFTDEATAKLALEKGLIGRSWNDSQNTIDALLNEVKNLTQETRYDEKRKSNYLADIDDSGKEVRRTYCRTDGTVFKIINLEYDEDGNIAKEIHVYHDGALSESLSFVQKDNESIPMTRTRYDARGNAAFVENYEYYEDGTYKGIMNSGDYRWEILYDENGNRIGYSEMKYTGEIPKYTGEVPAYDGTNGGVIVKALYDARSKLPIGTGGGFEAYNRVIKTIFGDKLSSTDFYTEAEKFTLKDGTTLYKTFRNGGITTIKYPDGTVEKYSPEGELLE